MYVKKINKNNGIIFFVSLEHQQNRVMRLAKSSTCSELNVRTTQNYPHVVLYNMIIMAAINYTYT